MKRTHAGFTLIELLIVVAIIGILAAIAIPNYQTYIAKSKVTEASTISDPARKAIVAAFNEGSLTGATNDKLGLSLPTDIKSRYVQSVTAVGDSESTGTVTVTMGGTGTSAIDGKTVVYSIACTSSGCSTSVSGTVPKEFLPKT